MTNAVTGDKIPSHAGIKRREIDAKSANNSSPTAVSEQTAGDDRSANVETSRGHERLTQQDVVARQTNIHGIDQARIGIARLQADIATDPAAVLRTAANLNHNRFEAAIAEPTG